MEIKKNKQGYRYIQVNSDIARKLMLGCICDSCGNKYTDGYLIFVLNRAYCKECFDKWSVSAKFYTEDLWFEKRKIKEYSKLFNR